MAHGVSPGEVVGPGISVVSAAIGGGIGALPYGEGEGNGEDGGEYENCCHRLFNGLRG